MNGLIYDTETSGLPKFKEPDSSPLQPIVVQLGVMKVTLSNDQLIATDSYSALASNTLGISVEQGAYEVTGIGDAELEGQPDIEEVMKRFLEDVSNVSFLIAHNASFDKKMMMCTAHHINRERSKMALDGFIETKQYCSMHGATPILKLPGRYGQYKWPKLTECYKHFFGKEMEDAHDALGDVKGTFEICNAMGFSALKRIN